MIDENLNQNIRTFQFKASMLQAANDDQQFLVIDLIVTFCKNHVLAIEDH